jgi:5S rRNA maturation endonuclease (ribonuclease M5)
MNHIADNLLTVCQDRGLTFKKQGAEFYASCPFHKDGKRPNFRVNNEKNTWMCDVCGEGGSVVEFIAKLENRDKKEVYHELAGSNIAPHGEIVATYDYKDRFGTLAYQVCRLLPKSFRQRRPDGKGDWIWNTEGVEKILYRLPELQNPKNPYVWIVEGEKDVETLRGIGMVATCNCSGAGKWHDAYAEALKGKDIVLCGDNDEPGRKHMKQVLASLEPHANSVRKIEIPAPAKDISDFAASFQDKVAFANALAPMFDTAQVLLAGTVLPIKSMAEMELEYIEHIKTSKTRTVNLGDWIPSLSAVRPLVGGELVSIVGDTGSLKTYVLQHIAMCCKVSTLLFELELPDALTFERFVGIATRKTGAEVYDIYRTEKRLDYSTIGHVFTCSKSRLTPEEIESLILKSELRIGTRPTLVLVDYIQLVKGSGNSRYEKTSGVAEQLKIVAKNTGTVIIMCSQIGRGKEGPEVFLHDAKDSGSIENSSGVVIGIWRDSTTPDELNLRVLKNTKGKSTQIIRCKIEDRTMRIVELSPVREQDIPIQNNPACKDN